MQKYKKIYYDTFNYPLHPDTYVESEISGSRAVDIHHIIGRGKKGECRIENLIALTREEHNNLGDKKHHMCYLLNKHRDYLIKKGIDFDKDWFTELLNKYESYKL